MNEPVAIDRLLIVQPGFLGDAVLASGLLRAARSLLPGSALGLLIRSQAAEIYTGHPALTWLHALDKRARGAPRAMSDELATVEYDAALIPHRSLRTSVIVHRARIPHRVGFNVSDGALLFTRRIAYRIGRPETTRNAALLGDLAGRVPDEAESRSWLEAETAVLTRVCQRLRLEESARLVLIAPGSVWTTKRWTERGFATVARELTGIGVRVLVVGSGDDRDRCMRIALDAGLPIEDVLAGDLSLSELVALCSLAERVVTNDSAPMHIAESVGTPVTAVFGPTVPGFGFGPMLAGSVSLGVDDLDCRPCRIHGSRRCPIGTHECMNRVSADQVLSTIL